MKNKSRMVLAAGILLLVVIVVIIAVRVKERHIDADVQTVIPVAVEVKTLAASQITEIITATGSVSAWRDVMVSSETSGRVTGVPVKVGDAVKAGQTLVRVDDELKVIAVEQAKAQLLAAEVNMKKADKDYQRAEKLFETKDIADVELEGNKLGLRAAEAQYKSAQVGLKYAQKQLDDSQIKAPVAGTIASKMVEVGEMVGPGRVVVNIVDMGKAKVKLSIPEEEIAKLHAGQSARLRADADTANSIMGSVYTVGSKSESPIGHSYPVEIVVAGVTGRALKAGMFVRVEITVQSIQHALTIAKEQLAADAATPSVYVVENTIAHLRPVKLGIHSVDRYQIVSGVKEGDLIISFGLKKIKDGSRVSLSAK